MDNMKNKWVMQAESWKLHLKEILEIKRPIMIEMNNVFY